MATMHATACPTATATGAAIVNRTAVAASTPLHRCLIREASLPSKVKVTNP